MKRLLIVLVFVPIVTRVLSQTTKGTASISGVVIDSLSLKPVEFANVAVFEIGTRKVIDGTICDDQGAFELKKLPAGNFQFEISFIGYSRYRRSFSLVNKQVLSLGKIKLGQAAKLLKEVEVTGEKTLVEEKVDRTIYNAEQDATTKGGDATDVLKRVPMLSVDVDGNVSLRGSTSIKVLINNKPSTIAASNVADALKQIPADMIKTVEVITSPSSKYDAEGSAGIINIILKKNTLDGIFFNVDGSAGSRGSNVSVRTNYRKGKMGFSAGAFVRPIYNVVGKYDNTQVTRNNGDTATAVQHADTRSIGLNSQYTLGWDFDINKNNSLSVTAGYGYRYQYAYQDQLSTNTYRRDSLPVSSLKDVQTSSVSDNFESSLNYTKAFAQKGREFNLMAVYTRSNQTNGYLINNLNEADQSLLSQNKNHNPGFNQELTIQADFQEPLTDNQTLEFGAKDVLRKAASDYDYYTSQGGSGNFVPETNGGLSNSFNYNQSITSGYASYTLAAANGYSLKAGGRYEYTHIAAYFKGEGDIMIPSYGVLVPSINLSRKLSNGNLIKFSYNRRIQRPSLQALNPNLQASNPLNATQGNPYLKPEYADNVEVAYNTIINKATLNFSSFIRYNTNDIQQARSIRNDTIIAIYQNIGTEANYGISVFATVPIGDRFTVNGGTDMYYRILKNNSNDPYIHATNQGFTGNYRVFGNYNFSGGWALQFFVFFPGKNINLQGYRTNPITQSISIKKDLWGKAGSIGLGIDNFATPAYRVYTKLESPYLTQTTMNTLYNFIVKVNFSYKIGKLAPERKRKTITEEEAN